MRAFSANQLRALHARAALAQSRNDRFGDGTREAQVQLTTTLRLYGGDAIALRRNLLAWLRDGPSWDVTDYQDGCAAVHDDVKAILDGDRRMIAELLDTLETQEGQPA